MPEPRLAAWRSSSAFSDTDGTVRRKLGARRRLDFGSSRLGFGSSRLGFVRLKLGFAQLEFVMAQLRFRAAQMRQMPPFSRARASESSSSAGVMPASRSEAMERAPSRFAKRFPSLSHSSMW